MMRYVSHISDTGSERPLELHLRSVGERAASFARPFAAEQWAQVAGLWHDLGKFQTRWQEYLRSQYADKPHEAEPKGSVPHSLAGAQYAERVLPTGLGRLLAYVIAGHHAGLPDFHPSDAGYGSLKLRLDEAGRNPLKAELERALDNRSAIPADILAIPALSPDLPRMKADHGRELALSLWVRMLFSCLVDADFLDAEAFLNPEQYRQRPRPRDAAALLPAFDAYMSAKAASAQPGAVNAARADVLAACRAVGRMPRNASGIYSLTVPTGGGKTLASLAFALEHAAACGKRRVIYAIPFTSIIEQTAQVFRNVFADDPGSVLEHHSNLDPAEQSSTSHLAAENWDAPLIVTTNVQLFESLFASRTSRCRRLHNLADSVIILDEAQQLPPAFLTPVTQTLKLLALHYGVTVLLCTATQPNLKNQTDAFGRTVFSGIGEVREIISDPAALYARLKRVEVRLPSADAPRRRWDELADELRAQPCALTIVNTRQDARDLYAALGADSGRVHLSARMCPEHRAEVIARIKARLSDGRNRGDRRPLHVVSTTLVEAGVDLDFPVVYRALAGLDSIAQAAGRCNREGRMEGTGRVVVFRPEHERGRGLMLDARNVADELIASGAVRDALAPETFARYFELFYGSAARNRGGLDAQGILSWLKPDPQDGAMAFRTAAERFRLIDEEGQHSVVVRYASSDAMRGMMDQALGALAKDPSQKWAYRRLQRFSVSVPPYEFKRMEDAQMLEPVAGLWVVREGWYDTELGLRMPEDGMTPTSSVL